MPRCQQAWSACTGGGRKIIRCEISLDGGKSWRLADIQRHAQPNAYGRHWAWVFYTLPISLGALLSMCYCAVFKAQQQ